MPSGVVLYIEDNPDNKTLVQRALESKGYTLVWAAKGEEGLAQAAALRPGVILLDINLPDIDGYEVARRLKSDPELEAIPIIAITANALKGDAEKALAAGCDLYMSKPIQLRELWARVSEVLPS
jgi:two-component system, cell cycle response regulator DivK